MSEGSNKKQTFNETLYKSIYQLSHQGQPDKERSTRLLKHYLLHFTKQKMNC